MTVPILRMLACLLAASMTIGACGGDDDDTSADATTTRPAGTRDQGDDGGGPDRALAERALLTLADLPAGWAEGDPPDEDDEDTFDACPELQQALDDTENDETGEAEAPEFTMGEITAIRSDATIWKDTAAAERAFAVVKRPEVPDCLSESLADELGENSEIDVGQPVTRPLPFPVLADDTFAYRVTVPLDVEDGTVQLYLDLVAVRAGRAGASIVFSYLGNPIDGALQQQLAGKVAERLRAA